MGLTIIGGLFTSTVLTLLVVPVLYKLFSSPVSQAEQTCSRDNTILG
jgi:Cu/Ag efflux pump CusA